MLKVMRDRTSQKMSRYFNTVYEPSVTKQNLYWTDGQLQFCNESTEDQLSNIGSKFSK